MKEAIGDEERTIEPAMANLLGIVFGTACTLVLIGLYRLVTGHVPLVGGQGPFGLGIVLAGILVGIPTHELLHSIGFRYIGRVRSSDIAFGFNLRALAPFVHCAAPVSVCSYRWIAALPGLVLGVLPVSIAILIDSGQLFAIGYVLSLAALGDAMLLLIMNDLDARQLVQDHPSKPGFTIVRSHSEATSGS